MHALQDVWTEIFHNKESSYEALCRGGDVDAICYRRRLNFCRNVGCFPKYVSGIACFRANHHFTGMDANAQCNAFSILHLERIVYGSNFLNQCESRANCTFCIMLVGLGVAKENENTIAQILCNAPIKSFYNTGGGLMISCDDIMPVFRIKLGGKLS